MPCCNWNIFNMQNTKPRFIWHGFCRNQTATGKWFETFLSLSIWMVFFLFFLSIWTVFLFLFHQQMASIYSSFINERSTLRWDSNEQEEEEDKRVYKWHAESKNETTSMRIVSFFHSTCQIEDGRSTKYGEKKNWWN